MELSRRGVMVNGAAALALAPLRVTAATPLSSAALHQKLVCLDTHLDTPMSFARTGWDMMQRHGGDIDSTQVDYPRMVEGGLDGGFFAIYTPQAPLTEMGMLAMRDAAFLRAAEIREMVAAHSDKFELAFVPEDAARIAAGGKRIVYQSIENSGVLGNDVSLLRVFYRLGVRMAGPVHFLNNQLGDSATDTKKWGGLSPMGKDFVALANDLGIILDASHASDDVFDQMSDLSRSAIICSHSGCRAVHDHPRNLDDARIKRLAAAGSTIQINSYNEYLVTVPPNPAREKAMETLYELRAKPGASAADFAKAARDQLVKRRALEKQYPYPHATFETYMQHVMHALDLVGPEHVGIGADWDGGGGVIGMEDITSLPKITDRLVKAGYTEAQLGNFWGGNALRVLGMAQAARKPA